MGHNSVVSGHLKYIGIPWVDGLSIGPSDLGCHSGILSYVKYLAGLGEGGALYC